MDIIINVDDCILMLENIQFRNILDPLIIHSF